MAESFDKIFRDLIEKVNSGVENLLSYFDRKVFINLVNCLKYEDEFAVKDALDQLTEEKSKLAIAPIYLASQKHPNYRVRDMCWKALEKIDDINEIKEVTKDKDVKDAVESLINKYGNYKYD